MTMKNKTTAALLAIFLGGIGAHKFYLKKYLWGIAYLIFCWTYIPSIIGLIEGIMYLCTTESDFQTKYCDKESQTAYRSSQNAERNLHSTYEYTPPKVEQQQNNSNYTPLEIPKASSSPKVESPSNNYTPLDIPKASTLPPIQEISSSVPSQEKETVEDSQDPMQLSDEEKEYVEEYRLYNATGTITEKERRLLDKLCVLSGISKERAEFLENLNI